MNPTSIRFRRHRKTLQNRLACLPVLACTALAQAAHAVQDDAYNRTRFAIICLPHTLATPARERQTARVTVLLNKPVGYVSGQAEKGYRPAVTLVRPESRFAGDGSKVSFSRAHLAGLAAAGRLDIDSQGLLVLTQDGRIAKQLIGEESEVEKEYLVRVQGTLDADGLALLNHGLRLDGQRLRPARVSWQNDAQLRFILCEGKKRQIRRMCELVGLKVVGLKRIRIGRVRLGDLPTGQWRYLRADETFV